MSRLRFARIILSVIGMDRLPNAVSELVQALDMPKALGDALQALISRDVNDLDRALITLGGLASKQLAAEEEGVLRGVLSVLRGDVYAVTDLIRALRLNKDAVEVLLHCAFSIFLL